MNGRRQFSVVLAPDLLARVGCPHYANRRAADCRPCTVTELLIFAAQVGHLQFDWTPLWDGSRRIAGEVLGGQGLIALTELLALAHDHPSPQRLQGWQTSLSDTIARFDGSLA